VGESQRVFEIDVMGGPGLETEISSKRPISSPNEKPRCSRSLGKGKPKSNLGGSVSSCHSLFHYLVRAVGLSMV
jgi:hypothetical protein